jgi:hypothetical protein
MNEISEQILSGKRNVTMHFILELITGDDPVWLG